MWENIFGVSSGLCKVIIVQKLDMCVCVCVCRCVGVYLMIVKSVLMCVNFIFFLAFLFYFFTSLMPLWWHTLFQMGSIGFSFFSVAALAWTFGEAWAQYILTIFIIRPLAVVHNKKGMWLAACWTTPLVYVAVEGTVVRDGIASGSLCWIGSSTPFGIIISVCLTTCDFDIYYVSSFCWLLWLLLPSIL